MWVYGRFLSINKASTAPTTMIATNRPAIAGTKYMSATDVGVGVGAVVAAGAGSTAKLVSEDDGQYDSDPANVAKTVYLPGMSGVHWKLNAPLVSLVVLPILR